MSPSHQMLQTLLDKGLIAEARKLELVERAKLPPEDRLRAPSVDTELWLMKFITCHKKLLKLKDDVRILACVNDPVLITGETGTGKELIARALHGGRHGKFVDINCAGMPENLLESELFGHVKGSFTGAINDNAGLLEAAKDGTMFLDEVGDLGYILQAKLLRVIQEGYYRPVGGQENKRCTCRFIAATHWPLSQCLGKRDVDKPKFRDDLYARLSVFELETLPLRERLEDIPLIIAKLDAKKKFPTTVNWQQTPLPFNVRSLQRLVRRHEVLGASPFNINETL
jgi:transcriptional regulator with GAF, ATPase, and Fis domain